MFQKDWLARQLEALATLSAQILLLRQKGDNKTAQDLIDAAYGEMLGFDPRLVGLLPTDFLINKVRTGDRIDGHRALVLAALLREHAGLAQASSDSALPDNSGAQALLHRSLSVFLACAEDGTLPPEHGQWYDPHQALDALTPDALAPELKYRLFHYFEDAGQYAEAENVLFDLIESSPAPQALIAEGVSFYEWLLEQDDADLITGNLPRDEVDESLARLLAMQSQTAA